MKGLLMTVSVAVLCTLLFSGYTSQMPGDRASSAAPSSNSPVKFPITNLSDLEYPDNPDIGFRTTDYRNDFFDYGEMIGSDDIFVKDLKFHTKDGQHLELSQLSLKEFIPTIHDKVKEDPFLSHIACINQEWNRNQVRFVQGEFQTSIQDVVRVDLARNCLNAYLWEIIIYRNEKGKNLPYAHGWFEFPRDTYAALFESKNGIAYSEFRTELENWKDPESQEVDMTKLRSIAATISTKHKDLSDNMYPLEGARKKKYKEIIYPTSFSSMRDLQTDAALFATFTPPGFYNRNDPRSTELGRIYKLEDVSVRRLKGQDTEPLFELELLFNHRDTKEQTKLIIGGLNFKDFPVLKPNEANKGWKNSMGIANHSFYETYEEHKENTVQKSSYYALLTDKDNNWLDSHKVGIDGPIFHFEDEEKMRLHLWLLSFERHALVGHYLIDLE